MSYKQIKARKFHILNMFIWIKEMKRREKKADHVRQLLDCEGILLSVNSLNMKMIN